MAVRRRIVASVLPQPGSNLVEQPFAGRQPETYSTDYLPSVVEAARELMIAAQRENPSALAFSVGSDAYLSLLCAEEMHFSQRESTYIYLPVAPEDSHFLGVPVFVDPALGRRDVRLLTQGRGVIAIMQQARQVPGAALRTAPPRSPYSGGGFGGYHE